MWAWLSVNDDHSPTDKWTHINIHIDKSTYPTASPPTTTTMMHPILSLLDPFLSLYSAVHPYLSMYTYVPLSSGIINPI